MVNRNWNPRRMDARPANSGIAPEARRLNMRAASPQEQSGTPLVATSD
jgi:hypothetical protein